MHSRSVILLICLTLWSGVANRAVGAEPATAPEKTTFGSFQFEVPEKWSSIEPDRKKTAAMLLLNGTTWYNADGVIKVDVGKPLFSSARETAKAMAGKDGKVYPDAIPMDGSEGVKLETNKYRHVPTEIRDHRYTGRETVSDHGGPEVRYRRIGRTRQDRQVVDVDESTVRTPVRS